MCWSSWATPQTTHISSLKNFSLIENCRDLNFWGWLFCFQVPLIRTSEQYIKQGFYLLWADNQKYVVWNMENKAWLSSVPQMPLSCRASHLIFLFLTSPLMKGKSWYFSPWKCHLAEATVFTFACKISLVTSFARHPVSTCCGSIITLEKRAKSRTPHKWVHQVLLLFLKGNLRNSLEAMNCCTVNVSNPLIQLLKEKKYQDFFHLLSQWGWDWRCYPFVSMCFIREYDEALEMYILIRADGICP